MSSAVVTTFDATDLSEPLALLSRPEVRTWPYPAYKALRESAPIANMGPMGYFLTRYSDIKAVFEGGQASMDPKYFESFQSDSPDDLWKSFFGDGLLFNDADRHMYLRSFAQDSFKPRRVRGLREDLQNDANSLLDRVADIGQMDLVTDFARPFTLTALMRMVGFPLESQEELLRWSVVMGEMLDPLKVNDPQYREPANSAFAESIEYMDELIEEKRRCPADDMMSDLVNKENRSGEGLNREEIIGITIRGALNAGHLTTTNQTGNNLMNILDYPDQVEELRGNSMLAPNAIEELFRFDGTIQMCVRAATSDIELPGTTIPGGSLMWLSLGGGNHDPEAFENPETVDIHRADIRSLASGGDEHYCLGASLARLETEVALTRMLDRFADIELTVPRSELAYDPNLTVRGVLSLPISFRNR